jgi:hypothetical protein
MEHSETQGKSLEVKRAFDRTSFETTAKTAERHGAESHHLQVNQHYAKKQ